jgi:hypothetical protein
MLMCRIMGCDHPLGLKEFLDQLNLLYIWICLYLQHIKSYACQLINRIMGCDHSRIYLNPFIVS